MSTAVDGRPAVLVVGAGPVGLLLSCELARRGVPLRVIDKLVAPTSESRAIVVHARSLEMMERVGALDALIASGVRTDAMEMHADGRTVARIALDTVDSPFPFSVTTAQTETERVLTERLAELGVTVDRGVELVSFTQDADGVRARLRRADGGEEEVATSWIAGTDGSRSAVRAQLGTRLEGSFEGERFLLGDVEVECDVDRRAIHTFFSPSTGPLIAFPMRGERMRLIAQLEDDAAAAADDGPLTLERFQRAVDERVGAGWRLTDSHWLTVFEIHHAQVPRYRHGRAFLAGDAAHVHSPAGGQGMNTGMQDAFNLGWKLALAAQGRAGDALLDSYHAERHPVAARVISQTTKLTSLATLQNELARKLRNHVVKAATALAPVQRALADEAEETDIRYRDSPVVSGRRLGGRHAPQPGDAAPDVPGSGLRAALLDGAPADAAHTLVTLLPAGAAVADAPQPPAADGARHVLVADVHAERAGYGTVLADPARSVAERYGAGSDGALVLVRPDGYVGALAPLHDADAIAAYFARLRA